MTLFDIILLGYVVNMTLTAIFIIIFTFLIITASADSPESVLEMKQFENNLAELNRLNGMAPFQEKYSGFFGFMIPFASVVRFYTLINGILREKNLPAYIESEIHRLRRVIENK